MGFRERTTAQGLPASERGQDANSRRFDSAADAGSSGWEMLKWSEMPRAAGGGGGLRKLRGRGRRTLPHPRHLHSRVLSSLCRPASPT